MATDVNYEPSVDSDFLQLESLSMFEKHRWIELLTCVPAFLLSEEVMEFYRTLKRDDEGSVTATVTVTKSTGKRVPVCVDVRASIRSLFYLPHEGEDISTLSSSAISSTMDKIIIGGKNSGTILVRDIQDVYKMLIKIMKESFLGMLGSRDQVSAPQQRVLAALLSNIDWDWEEVFINVLLDAAKHSKFWLGSKVSALILYATEDSGVVWPKKLDYTLSLIAGKRGGKKKAAISKASAKTSEEVQSSSSD